MKNYNLELMLDILIDELISKTSIDYTIGFLVDVFKFDKEDLLNWNFDEIDIDSYFLKNK